MEDNSLVCPNCKHDFDFNEHLPKLLDCNAIICLSCLKNVKKLRFSSKFKCLADKKHKHKYPKKNQEFDHLPNEQVSILMIKVREYNKKLDEFENMLNNFDKLSRNQMEVIAKSKGIRISVCPKCFQEYNTTDRQPRLLDNSKQVCSLCVRNFARELNVIVKECHQFIA